MKRIIILIVTFIMIFSCVACNSNSNNSDENNKVIDQVLTENYILYNASTEYVLVVSEEATDTELTAKDDITALFFEATGIKLEFITDSGLTHTDSAKYISIGNTALLESSGIAISEELEVRNSYQITTKGNSVYIIGGPYNGVRYGAFEFLFRILNFEQFSYDCYSLDKCVTEIPLYNYTIVDAPDMPLSMAFPGYMQNSEDLVVRMKAGNKWLSLPGGIAKYGKSGTSHNTLFYIDPVDYMEEHPKWYSYPNPSQLCFMARGDESEREKLLQTFTENLIEQIKMQPGKIVWEISNMDDGNCCACNVCMELKAKYKCDTAQMYWFCRDMYYKVAEWFKTEEGEPYANPDFRLEISHYLAYSESPAQYNEETGKYEPIDETVVMPKGVGSHLAPMLMNWIKPIDDPVNVNFFNQIKKLSAITQHLSIWAYSTNFNEYLYPFDVFSSIQRNYQIFYEHGADSMIDETQNGNYQGMTGWHMLTAYLSSRFSWNVYDDQEALIERFMNGYFMDAAGPMKNYFESFRRFSQFQQTFLATDLGSIYYAIGNKELWPKVYIDEWQGYIDEAMAKIERYKTIAPETYEMLYNHISIEQIFIDNCYIKFYPTNLGSKYSFHVNRFAENVLTNKILLDAEHGHYMPDYVRELQEAL